MLASVVLLARWAHPASAHATTPNALPLRLAVSTYWGGSRFEHIRDVTTDRDGNLYVTGGTESPNFSVTGGAYQTTHNPGTPDAPAILRFDVFVTKIDLRGNIVWSTFIGGPNYDRAYAIEVDSDGYIYVAGRAGCGFPVTPGAFQTGFQGGQEAAFYGPQDGFVAKLTPDGSTLVWASYFGTSDSNIIRDLDLDPNGDVCVVSSYASGAYPPAVAAAFGNGYQPTPRGGRDLVVAKIAADGTQVRWASFLGGTGNEGGGPSIRVGAEGDVYAAVATNSTNLPATRDAYDRTFNGGANDIFVARFTPDGARLVFGTYLGGDGNEELETHNLALDAAGNAYIATGTTSGNFPTTPGAFQETYRGAGDLFVAKISADGSHLLASTFVGGGAFDFAEGIAIGANGDVYVSGGSASDNFPVTPDAWQPGKRGQGDAIAVTLSADLGELLYSTYLGGGLADSTRACCVDAWGNFYVAGQTASTDWPVRNALQPVYGGNVDALLTRFLSPRQRPRDQTPQDVR